MKSSNYATSRGMRRVNPRKGSHYLVLSSCEIIYSSKYHFLYELIQNADDSLYRKVSDTSGPLLTFKISPSRFIVETNEDGFTRANVEAICKTEESSKRTSALDDHIGEKGIGFKSVFAVANKAHIQSGVWSFYFEHNEGEDGLGITTPIYTPLKDLNKNVTTKITLTLKDKGQDEYGKLIKAVESIPNSVILFLRKIHNITIFIENPNQQTERTVIRKATEVTPSIIRTVRERGVSQASGSGSPKAEEDKYYVATHTTEDEYYVATHTIRQMPRYHRRQGRDTATVQLAFPVNTGTREPKLSVLGQHVFAYLPVQRIPQLKVSH